MLDCGWWMRRTLRVHHPAVWRSTQYLVLGALGAMAAFCSFRSFGFGTPVHEAQLRGSRNDDRFSKRSFWKVRSQAGAWEREGISLAQAFPRLG
jgi:hypothetical protein